MTPPPALRILAAAGVLTIVLVGFVVAESVARAQGREIAVALGGYDPRGLLTGNYVALDLIDDAPRCPPGAGPSRDKRDWVALAPRGGRYAVAGVASTPEAASRLGPVVVRGAARCFSAFRTGAPMQVRLDIGIDRFHVQQSDAMAMEQALRVQPRPDPPALAVLSVGRDGRARLKAVIIDQRRTDLRWF